MDQKHRISTESQNCSCLSIQVIPTCFTPGVSPGVSPETSSGVFPGGITIIPLHFFPKYATSPSSSGVNLIPLHFTPTFDVPKNTSQVIHL